MARTTGEQAPLPVAARDRRRRIGIRHLIERLKRSRAAAAADPRRAAHVATFDHDIESLIVSARNQETARADAKLN